MTDHRKLIDTGTEDFRTFRGKDFFVDKSAWIRKLVTQGGRIMLFTPPRRFGKTLTRTIILKNRLGNLKCPTVKFCPELQPGNLIF